MAHHHGHSHGHSGSQLQSREKGIYKVTIIGGVVNLLLVVFKFTAGILGRSAAMVADAVHSLSDFVTDVIVIAFVRVSGRPKDSKHNYGHGKFETLASLIISVILIFIGIGIAYNGLSDVIAVIGGATLPSPGMLAFWAAIVSIVLKEAIFRYTVVVGRKVKSDAVIANAWHHRSDALSSIGTALGIGGAIFLGERWTVLDPIAAVVVSFFIIKIGIELFRPAIDELMERSLAADVEEHIIALVEEVEGVSDLHDLKTRKIGNNCAIEFHVRMDGGMPLTACHSVVSILEQKLKESYGSGAHINIHVEPSGQECCGEVVTKG